MSILLWSLAHLKVNIFLLIWCLMGPNLLHQCFEGYSLFVGKWIVRDLIMCQKIILCSWIFNPLVSHAMCPIGLVLAGYLLFCQLQKYFVMGWGWNLIWSLNYHGVFRSTFSHLDIVDVLWHHTPAPVEHVLLWQVQALTCCGLAKPESAFR